MAQAILPAFKSIGVMWLSELSVLRLAIRYMGLTEPPSCSSPSAAPKPSMSAVRAIGDGVLAKDDLGAWGWGTRNVGRSRWLPWRA